MTNSGLPAVPVWTLTTQEVNVPEILADAVSPERLRELRGVLAAMAAAPIVTLEAHPAPTDLDRSTGMPLDAASPLATHLSNLIKQTSTPVGQAGASSETLYRMVVPAKVASEWSSGLVKPMASKAAAGGIYGALTKSSGIAAQATFIPVAGGKAAAAGAVGGSAATVGATAATATALTVAAPLVLMAVAVGVSAHAEQKRQQAIEKITSLLEKLHDDALQQERTALNGCRSAIETATAILLDQGRIGASVGLGNAVHTINTAVAQAEHRLQTWKKALKRFQGRRVGLASLREKFTGIDDGNGGLFRAHLDIAELAIALKKRVLVLQAVEHAQMDESNAFESFVRAIKTDQRHLEELEAGIAEVLTGLSNLELDRARGIRDVVFSRGEVDELLHTSHLLHELGNEISIEDPRAEVAIEMLRAPNGSVTVFPAHAI